MRTNTLKYLGATALLAGTMAVTALPAIAQGGGGGGGGGGGAGTGNMAQSGDLDRDRIRDQVQDPDRDYDRDRDRDRLRDPDRDRLYLGTQDRIRAHDQDGDRLINRPEFEGWHQDLFGQMDANGDGLTLQEYHATRFGPGPYGTGNPEQQALMREQANLRKTERFRIMDGDGDGMVTREEFMRFGEHAWLEADTNDDGQLTARELQQFNRGM